MNSNFIGKIFLLLFVLFLSSEGRDVSRIKKQYMIKSPIRPINLQQKNYRPNLIRSIDDELSKDVLNNFRDDYNSKLAIYFGNKNQDDVNSLQGISSFDEDENVYNIPTAAHFINKDQDEENTNHFSVQDSEQYDDDGSYVISSFDDTEENEKMINTFEENENEDNPNVINASNEYPDEEEILPFDKKENSYSILPAAHSVSVGQAEDNTNVFSLDDVEQNEHDISDVISSYDGTQENNQKMLPTLEENQYEDKQNVINSFNAYANEDQFSNALPFGQQEIESPNVIQSLEENQEDNNPPAINSFDTDQNNGEILYFIPTFEHE